MKSRSPILRSLGMIAPFALGISLAHAVPVRIPAEADLEVRENFDADTGLTTASAGPFDATDLNARFSDNDRNEILVLRFNLAGHERSQIAGASIRLINQRANSSSQTLRIYGVNDGATGYNAVTETEGTATDNNWPEDGTDFSTTPGLEFDASSTTRGIRFERVTDLGTGAAANTAEGTPVSIGTAALRDFLIGHEDDIVTILVVSESVNGNQKRFASREATTLASGGEPRPAGTYAPSLIIDLPGIRVPASADIQLNEHTNSSSGGSNTSMNSRFSPIEGSDGRNEIIALRFDLTGHDPSEILSADLQLVNHRNNGGATLRFYGVIDGSTGYDALTDTEGGFTDNDWPEGSATRFSNMPGLEYDGSNLTAGVRSDRTVDLGTVIVSAGNGNINSGTRVSFFNDAFIDFIKNHPDNLITILVVSDTAGSGQKRYATKETVLLDPPGDPQPAGTYAPEINLFMENGDRDGDGLLNHWEILHGFDPDLADSDGNGIPDGEEDSDEDGLNNLGEQAMGTDPWNHDTDDDGLLDGVETNTGIWVSISDTGTNPLLADSDGDDLPDGIENPDLPFLDETQPGTDPNLRDSDFDLYSDGAEIARGSDPTDFNDVPDGAVLEVLGIGTDALLPGPLTDRDNNIDDSTPAGANFDWIAVTSTPAKDFFGTGTDPQTVSGAYDLFDNKVGALNDKWLGSGVNVVDGAHVTVEFPGTVSLDSFTIASADDRPDRDPVDWQILGSTDGVDFEPIFTQLDPARLTIWSARRQVIKGTLADATPEYRFLRFACTKVGVDQGQVHVNEVQYFGILTPDAASADFRIIGFSGGPGSANLSLTWTSQPGATYRIGYSTTLADGFSGTAAANIDAEAGGTTTHVFPNPAPGAPRLFLAVEGP